MKQAKCVVAPAQSTTASAGGCKKFFEVSGSDAVLDDCLSWSPPQPLAMGGWVLRNVHMHTAPVPSLDQLAHSGCMEQLNVHEAKTQFSDLLRRVAEGEEFTIARAGHPVARLVPAVTSQEPRVSGWMRGRIKVSPDFDATSLELLDAFEGKGSTDETTT